MSKKWLIVIVVLCAIVGGQSFLYYLLYTEHQTLSVKYTVLRHEHTTLQEGYETLESEYGTLESKYARLSSEHEELSLVYEALERDYASLAKAFSSLESELAEAEGTISNLRSQMEILRQTAEENKFMFYYASLAEQRYGVDDLEEYLDRWQWSEGSYTMDVFDCSEMSAYLEWKLENEGYHTYIVIGETPWGNGYHAWLLVETSPEHYMPVEATIYDLVKWDDPYFDNYFEYNHLFETIQDALEYNYEEFDWWQS